MPKPLTGEDAVKVSIATKGERYAHRRWPDDVVIRFAAAEVVTAAEVRDPSRPRGAGGRLSRIRSRLRLLRLRARMGREGPAICGSVFRL